MQHNAQQNEIKRCQLLDLTVLDCVKAVQSGKFDDVQHLRGGLYSWYNQKLPIDGEYDGSYAGRTPSVVEEKEFSYGRPPTLLETEDNLGKDSQ